MKIVNGKVVKNSNTIKYGDKPLDHDIIDLGLYGLGKVAVMTREGEARKMLNLVRSDRQKYRVAANSTDLDQLPFNNDEGGWFIALLPIANSKGGITAYNPDPAHSKNILAKFQTSQFVDGYYLVSTYTDWLTAKSYYQLVHDNFATALVGYSTREHLHVLAENPENY